MKVIGVHLDRCTGCRTCELYCATERGSTGKTLLKAVQESPLPQARLRVEGGNEAPIAMQCRHCLKAPCMEACLNAALVRDPKTDLVVVKEDRCIACWTCTIFCPFGVIFPWPERKMALTAAGIWTTRSAWKSAPAARWSSSNSRITRNTFSRSGERYPPPWPAGKKTGRCCSSICGNPRESVPVSVSEKNKLNHHGWALNANTKHFFIRENPYGNDSFQDR